MSLVVIRTLVQVVIAERPAGALENLYRKGFGQLDYANLDGSWRGADTRCS
jgi:hypothetical protein